MLRQMTQATVTKMANAVEISIQVKGMRRMQTILGRIAKKATSRRDLHARWSILALNWINKNFQSEGGMVGGWAPLSPNTLAGRGASYAENEFGRLVRVEKLSATARRFANVVSGEGSGRILQNTGYLRSSFVPSWTSEQASVGSPLDIALYHEKGTKPYIIRPKKPGGSLRFAVATSTGIKTRTFKSGKKISVRFAKGNYVYAKEVHHPGLPARPMLPRANEPTLTVELMKAALGYLREQESIGNVED